MDPNDPVPEADALEQSDAAEEVSSRLHDVGEKPEADALEQERPVDRERTRVVSPSRDDVPEADWLEQSIIEPLDDEEPR